MHHSSCPGPLKRRNFLQAGSLLLGGLGLADLLRLRATANRGRLRLSPRGLYGRHAGCGGIPPDYGLRAPQRRPTES